MRRYSLRWVFANRVGGGSVPAPGMTPKPPSQFPLEPQPGIDPVITPSYPRTPNPGGFGGSPGAPLQSAPFQPIVPFQPIAQQPTDPGNVPDLSPSPNQTLALRGMGRQLLQPRYSLGDMNPVITPSYPVQPKPGFMGLGSVAQPNPWIAGQGGWNAAATPGQWHAGTGGWNAAATPGRWKAWQQPQPPQPPRVPTRGDMIFNALFDYLSQPHQ